METASRFRRYRYCWDLVAILVQKDIQLRYKSSSLGFLWSLAHPVALGLVLSFVFKGIFKVQVENHTLFLMAGLFSWQWLANCIGAAPGVFFQNGAILKKLRVPTQLLCLATVGNHLVHFVMTLPVFAAAAWLYGISPGWAWVVGVPLLVVLQAVLTFGVVVLLASLNVYLRDLEHVVQVGLLLLFYLTPIVFDISMISERLPWIPYVNPAAPIILSWQALLLKGQLSPFIPMAAIHAAGSLVLGLLVHVRLRSRLVETL